MTGLGGYEQILRLPIHMRRSFIHQFIDQKEKEHKQMENERRKVKRK